MSPLLICLLAFAVWTLIVLMVGVGLRRWALILTGKASLTDFPGDKPHGSDAYRRAMRAHANCVENLPVFAAIALVAETQQISGPMLELLPQVLIAARVGQTLVHMAFVETNVWVFVRFSFFLTQVLAMLWMAGEIATLAKIYG